MSEGCRQSSMSRFQSRADDEQTVFVFVSDVGERSELSEAALENNARQVWAKCADENHTESWECRCARVVEYALGNTLSHRSCDAHDEERVRAAERGSGFRRTGPHAPKLARMRTPLRWCPSASRSAWTHAQPLCGGAWKMMARAQLLHRGDTADAAARA